MSLSSRPLYSSPNGDHWLLVHETDNGRLSIRHEPNQASGGRISHIDLGAFLSQSPQGPQHHALLRLIASLVDFEEGPGG